MKRLLVFRHAKAGPHDEAHDRQRALIDRGRNDAALIGRTMRDKGYLPDLILCSSAKRTMETWEHAAPALATKSDVRFLDELYDAPEKLILKVIQRVKKSAPVLMYIGHNPGLENLARKLARKPVDGAEKKRLTTMEKKFPTGAVAVLDFDVNEWGDIDAGAGALTDFFAPADLKSN